MTSPLLDIDLDLTDAEQRWLRGEDGPAMQLAMRLIASAAQVSGATELVAVDMAHLNSTHYSGRMSLDFAEFLLEHRVSFAVPTHSNSSLISCSSPAFRPQAESPDEVAGAERVMWIYEELGCSAMWSCAPYQQPDGRPTLGQHVIGSESNAVGFVNSVLGARTNKYGDMLDVAGALVGRVPLTGLHTTEGRRGNHIFDVTALPAELLTDPTFPHLLGIVLGREVGAGVPVVVGLQDALLSEDDLKAIAAAAASAGGVGLFHIVGITPEADSLDSATQGVAAPVRTTVTTEMLSAAEQRLSSAGVGDPVRAVCVGTPHFSVDECLETLRLLDGRHVHANVSFIITTSRAVWSELELRGVAAQFDNAGVDVVLDTCSYFTPRPAPLTGTTLTNSAKWAYYAQGILDIPIGFASIEGCVESAIAGAWQR